MNKTSTYQATHDSNVTVFDSNPDLIKEIRNDLVESEFDQQSLNLMQLNPFEVTSNG